jgi:hypothetical protein
MMAELATQYVDPTHPLDFADLGLELVIKKKI